jgi:hypothetical protein
MNDELAPGQLFVAPASPSRKCHCFSVSNAAPSHFVAVWCLGRFGGPRFDKSKLDTTQSIASTSASTNRPCRFFRICNGEKDSGFETTAEPFGQPGQFHGVANGLFPVVQFQIASERPCDIGPSAEKLGGSSRLPVLLRQLGKPVEGRQGSRIGLDQKC